MKAEAIPLNVSDYFSLFQADRGGLKELLSGQCAGLSSVSVRSHAAGISE
jgi:hypothetical protein